MIRLLVALLGTLALVTVAQAKHYTVHLPNGLVAHCVVRKTPPVPEVPVCTLRGNIRALFEVCPGLDSSAAAFVPPSLR